MRLAGLPIVMSLALFAAPVFAQSSTTATSPTTSSNASNPSRDHGVSTDTQQKIRHSLEQNGFKNVQVIPQSFVIRAQAPDGSRVVMEVSPDQFEEVIAPPVRSGNSTSPNRSNLQGSTSSSTGNSLDNNSGGTSSTSSPSTNSSTGNSLNDNSPSSSSSSNSSSGSMSR
jgi:hypothetical protein